MKRWAWEVLSRSCSVWPLIHCIAESIQGPSVPTVTGSAFLSSLVLQEQLSGVKGEVAAYEISSMAETLQQLWPKDMCLKEQTVLTSEHLTEWRLVGCAPQRNRRMHAAIQGKEDQICRGQPMSNTVNASAGQRITLYYSSVSSSWPKRFNFVVNRWFWTP